jgi:lipoate-protein ligase A
MSIPPARREPESRSPAALELAEPVHLLTAAENIAADDRALRAGRPAYRVGVIADRTVSYGVGVQADAPFVLRCEAEGVPAHRRSSGGTGFLHQPGDLVWSVILPRNDPRVGRDFLRSFARFGAGASSFLSGRGVPVHWVPAPGVLHDYCPLSDRGEVPEGRGRILGGAAQHLSGATLLHQGTFSLTVDRPLLDRLFDPASSGASQRLGSLREMGIEGEPLDLAGELAAAIDATPISA